jgi:hypothetical protein
LYASAYDLHAAVNNSVEQLVQFFAQHLASHPRKILEQSSMKGETTTLTEYHNLQEMIHYPLLSYCMAYRKGCQHLHSHKQINDVYLGNDFPTYRDEKPLPLTENVLRILWHLLEEKGCAKFGKI